MKHTLTNYKTYQDAYDYFNKKLFGGQLPECLITMTENRRRKAMAYYANKRFVSMDGNEKSVDEIFLNTIFFNMGDMETLSSLVHEMAHQFQYNFGKPGKHGYHNKEFASIMEKIGLMCSHTGQPDGKKTGVRMSHYIIEDGDFEREAKKLLGKGFVLPYRQQGVYTKGKKPKPKPTIRTKSTYECDMCGNKAWGKPNMYLHCGDCDMPLKENNEITIKI